VCGQSAGTCAGGERLQVPGRAGVMLMGGSPGQPGHCERSVGGAAQRASGTSRSRPRATWPAPAPTTPRASGRPTRRARRRPPHSRPAPACPCATSAGQCCAGVQCDLLMLKGTWSCILSCWPHCPWTAGLFCVEQGVQCRSLCGALWACPARPCVFASPADKPRRRPAAQEYAQRLDARKAAAAAAAGAGAADGGAAAGALPAGLKLEDAGVLAEPGRRDGQIAVVRERGAAVAYSWDAGRGQWEKVRAGFRVGIHSRLRRGAASLGRARGCLGQARQRGRREAAAVREQTAVAGSRAPRAAACIKGAGEGQ